MEEIFLPERNLIFMAHLIQTSELKAGGHSYGVIEQVGGLTFLKIWSNLMFFFLGNNLHMECLWFCFANLIQADLDKVKELWNSHYIRKSRFDTIAGIPDILYFLPESVGKRDCLIPVSNQQIQAMEVNCELDEPAENLYLEYFEHVLTEMDLRSPSNEEEASHLFQLLMNFQQ